MRLAGIVSILVVAVIAAMSASAWADGDPASDFLITNPVFLTSQSAAASPAQRQRALFVWPFYPQDVERELRQLN